MQWRVNPARASPLNLVEYHCIKAGKNTIQLPAIYGGIVIEAAVEFMYRGRYTLKQPFTVKYVDQAAKYNEADATNKYKYCRAMFHFKMYELAKYLDFPLLKEEAQTMLRGILVPESNPFTIGEFVHLVEHVWKGATLTQSWSDKNQEDRDLRRMLATFGAVWDRAWMKNSYHLWNKLTDLTGEFQAYAIGHAEARRVC
ncbi:hypothetical protein BU23DRAFT_568672 [Bimuria novae-zelandiae CBS 107.79]|uniref:BTB domain-containing protein n=1 Tax=Bimuria novae-zelandiae CBS 107.79 TaxID=1447943 RepID=A0A6A5VCS6_9PLEO|nr:hypothetical protein BU23DRAFT_568672 [Bimuria novae-zelandiae CBS 107.79]